MKKGIYGFIIFLISTGIYSCDKCGNIMCDICPPDSYSWKTIYYYDSTIINKSETKYFYLYETDSTGKTLHFDSIYNQNYDHWGNRNSWNQVKLDYFNKLTPQNARTKFFLVTLKDSIYPVRIKNIKIGFKDGGKDCCACDDYFIESIKINNKEYKREELPIKIN